jgi:carboxyl-terminal processing protease
MAKDSKGVHMDNRMIKTGMILLGLILLTTGCISVTPMDYKPPEVGDYSEMGWVEAFDSMHKKMVEEYAFTEWRNVDWALKKDEFRPLIEKAWETQDTQGYYIALRKYLFSIPDGHVALIASRSFIDNGMGIYEQEVGGGFGMTVVLLDDGRLIANWVDAFGPAGLSGLQVGAEILAWDDKPVMKALQETSILWSAIPQATTAGQDYERTRFIVRAPIGAIRTVTFQNPGGVPITTKLKAIDDAMETLKRTDAFGSGFFGIPVDKFIQGHQLQNDIGYIKIYGEADKEGQIPSLDMFSQMIEEFETANVKGLILDLRGNVGGADAMAAAFLNPFYQSKTFYEYTSWYNSATGEFEIIQVDEITEEISRNIGLYIEPASSRFTGNVIALVNHGCISSGEGVAMGIRNLDHGEVVGFRGTNGSFGMVMGPVVKMPEHYMVMYPVGRSLDEDMKIQLDSDGYEGGVSPTITIPMTFENALALGSGIDVELQYALDILNDRRESLSK